MALTESKSEYQRDLVSLAHSPRSIDPMERYATRRFHMGNCSDPTIISSPSSLRTTLPLMEDGMLGTYPSRPILGYLEVSELMHVVIFLK